VRERIRWMGRHSGYDPLCDALSATGACSGRTVELRVGARLAPGVRGLLGGIRRRGRGSPFYNDYSALAELRVLARARTRPVDVVHLTYVENQFGLLGRARGWLDAALVGTVHQPPGWYRLRHKHAGALAAFDALIALGRREATWFEELAPGRVHYVPYAVDSDFFRPAEAVTPGRDAAPRVVFGGRWLRDWDTLVEVVDRVLARDPHVRFDLLVPQDVRSDARLLRAARHPQVTWHGGLSDARLLALYQRASLLLLPMVDCVGNSVLLEAIACGLPVVASDVGAMRDYTREDFASLHPVADAGGMAEAVLELAGDPGECERRGKAARAFAEEALSWEQTARETLRVYQAARARWEEAGR
jgi:glycosyltransferase involved in cell wall biosynthesis